MKQTKIADYIGNLRARFEYAHKRATQTSKKRREKYGIRTKGATEYKGCKTFMKTNAFDGKHKLSDK